MFTEPTQFQFCLWSMDLFCNFVSSANGRKIAYLPPLHVGSSPLHSCHAFAVPSLAVVLGVASHSSFVFFKLDFLRVNLIRGVEWHPLLLFFSFFFLGYVQIFKICESGSNSSQVKMMLKIGHILGRKMEWMF